MNNLIYKSNTIAAKLNHRSCDYIASLASMVSKNDFYYNERPLLYPPHIMVASGLPNKNVQYTSMYLSSIPLDLEVDCFSILPSGEGHYHVLSAVIKSESLVKLNTDLQLILGCEEEVNFIPCVSIAYLKAASACAYETFTAKRDTITTSGYVVFDKNGGIINML